MNRIEQVEHNIGTAKAKHGRGIGKSVEQHCRKQKEHSGRKQMNRIEEEEEEEEEKGKH